jgi:regulatory protein
MQKHDAKPPARMSETTLGPATLAYLARYATSTGNLRRVLIRKIRRSVAHYGDDPEPLLAMVDQLVARHAASGAVDDRLYSESQTRKLRRRGASGRTIQQTLGAKGIPAEIIAEAAESLSSLAEDRAAAIRLAKRRRLGPFRMTGRAEHRQKDMAALGRAGFGYQLAAEIIDADDIVSLASTPGGL